MASTLTRDQKQGVALFALAGFLLGMGLMLIILTATAPPPLKCTWPSDEQQQESVFPSVEALGIPLLG
jgi:hypothetical protein